MGKFSLWYKGYAFVLYAWNVLWIFLLVTMEFKKSLEKKLKDAKMHTLWNIDDFNKSIST